MLKDKETALIVKAKLEILREKLQEFIEHGDFDALSYVYVGTRLNYDDKEIEVNAYDELDEISTGIDNKIAKITKKHLLKSI